MPVYVHSYLVNSPVFSVPRRRRKPSAQAETLATVEASAHAEVVTTARVRVTQLLRYIFESQKKIRNSPIVPART